MAGTGGSPKAPTRRRQRPHARQRGIAYVALLMAVAIIAIVAGTAADVYQQARQRSREIELLWIGNQFRSAIISYREASPANTKAYPQRLEDLLLDPRFPGTRRHLRRIYSDPMTGKPDWELIMAQEGGIAGVKSRSTLTPLKQHGFRPRDEHLEEKQSYAEWEFTAVPPVSKTASGNTPAQGAPGMPPLKPPR